jgi:CYTH domain-containing protein
VCKEFLQEITKEEFDLLESTAICAIQKIRYIFNIEGIKYEFDVFTSLDIVTCEIETKTQDNIEIPEFMQKYLIADITHIKSLSNLSLALKYGKINN